MAEPIAALFESKEKAASAIHDLKASGFPDQAIGLVTPGAMDGNYEHRRDDDSSPDSRHSDSRDAASGSLSGMDIPSEEAALYEAQVQGGQTLVMVQPNGREILANDILRRHGGDTSAGNTGKGQPGTQNRAQSSGQWRDMMRSASDDGTVPPTAVREAVTTPEQGGNGMLLRNGGALDYPRAVPTPETRPTGVDGTPGYAETQSADDYPRAEVPNTAALSPEDPRRESDEGQPYLDDANPYGRQIENRDGEPMGGAGMPDNPEEPALRAEREQPGESAAHPLPQALDPEPFHGKPED